MALMDNVLCGLIAGLIATVPMTFMTFLLFYYLPKHEHYSLPTFHISKLFSKKRGFKDYTDPPQQPILSFVNHFGYGAIAGAIFAASERAIPHYFILKGLIFGLFVWIFSYFFLMPNMGIFPTPEKKSSNFNFLMMTSHIVWGLILAICYIFFTHECGLIS